MRNESFLNNFAEPIIFPLVEWPDVGPKDETILRSDQVQLDQNKQFEQAGDHSSWKRLEDGTTCWKQESPREGRVGTKRKYIK